METEESDLASSYNGEENRCSSPHRYPPSATKYTRGSLASVHNETSTAVSWRPPTYKEIQSENITVQATAIISMAMSVLRKKQEPKLLEHLVTLLRELLYSVKTGRSEKAHRLVSLGGVPLLLQALVDALTSNDDPTATKPALSDATCASLFHVLATIGKKDKNFRPLCLSCGAVGVTLGALNTFRPKPKLLQSVLLFLKILAAKPPTVGALVSEGVVETLKTLLLDSSSKNGGRLPSSLVNLYLLQVLCLVARKSRLAVAQMSSRRPPTPGNVASSSASAREETSASDDWSNSSILRLMVNLLDPRVWKGTATKKSPRMAKLLRTILNLLNHAASTKPGRQCLLEEGILNVLFSWAEALPSSQPLWTKHVLLVSSIVQRALPPLLLPIRYPDSYQHPIKTRLPQSEDEDSDSHVRLESSEDESSSSSEDSDYELEEEYREKENREEDDEKRHHQPSPGVEKSKEFRSQLGDEELCAYGAFFGEFRDSSPPPPNSGDLIGVKEYHDNQIGEEVKQNGFGGCAATVKNLYRSAKESMCREKFLNKLDFEALYRKCCEQTIGPTRWVDYPVYLGTKTENTKISEMKNTKKKVHLEPFYVQPPNLIRYKTLEHIRQRVANHDKGLTKSVPEYDSRHNQTVFDLDSVLRKNYASETGDEKYSASLRFESRFESGNLRKAFQVGDREYDFLLSPDINTDYHHQWFYFRVSNFKVEGSSSPYIFNIINCEKSSSQFNAGMQPVMYSMKGRSWRRVGEDVCYYRNHYVRPPSPAKSRIIRPDGWKDIPRPYYTLTFSVRFTDEDDVCYLAFFYPYTFSLMKLHIYCWEHSYDTSSIYYKRDEICKTLLGNPVFLLTITQKPLNPSRRYVVLSARVHPGESNSSWVLKGVLDYLLSDTRRARKLRQTFVFKVLPMLNPDGVISGSHRCSLSGMDLNRQWASPSCLLHAPIFHSKALVQHLTAHRGPPLVYCDFHGHSRKYNVFLYGCNSNQSWLRKDRSKRNNDKSYLILPEMLSQSAAAFNLEDCSFEIEAGKEATARVTVWREFKVNLSYTMECTFSGCDQGPYSGFQLALEQLIEMGGKFAQALSKLSP